MKGVKYIIAAVLLVSLQLSAKMAEKIEVVEMSAPTMKVVAPSCNCECVTPTIELVDECVQVKKKACPVRFKTVSDWQCVRTYEAGNNEDECVTMHNGEVVTDSCCKPVCNPCKKECCPKPCCKPCKRRFPRCCR